jgi:hypothetical protein
MSLPAEPPAVKPVVSLILARIDLAAPVIRRLSGYFGPVDLVGPFWPFTYTEYYNQEMGEGLCRGLVAFLRLADGAFLPEWKLFTNGVEADFALGGRRLVNLDPGYVSRERLVLATGKNYSHRIYLSQGIYGDLTLLAGKGGLHALPWTYRDYAENPLRDLLNLVRRKYLWQLRQLAQRCCEA